MIIVIIIILIVARIIKEEINKNIEINIDELAEKITTSNSFEDELSKIDDELAIDFYDLNADTIEEIVSYQGSGASSEEILILKLKDTKNIGNIKEILESRLSEKKEAFESYLPKEVSKIENRILEEKGKYIILCISNDYNTVNKIINDYLR